MWYHGPWLYHKPVGSWDQHVVELQTNHTQPYLGCLSHMLHCLAFDVQPYLDVGLSGEWFVGSIKENQRWEFMQRHAVGRVKTCISYCSWSYLFFGVGTTCMWFPFTCVFYPFVMIRIYIYLSWVGTVEAAQYRNVNLIRWTDTGLQSQHDSWFDNFTHASFIFASLACNYHQTAWEMTGLVDAHGPTVGRWSLVISTF